MEKNWGDTPSATLIRLVLFPIDFEFLHTKLRHCLSRHFCLILLGPPNFFMSC